jgi:hypothetical protein
MKNKKGFFTRFATFRKSGLFRVLCEEDKLYELPPNRSYKLEEARHQSISPVQASFVFVRFKQTKQPPYPTLASLAIAAHSAPEHPSHRSLANAATSSSFSQSPARGTPFKLASSMSVLAAAAGNGT